MSLTSKIDLKRWAGLGMRLFGRVTRAGWGIGWAVAAGVSGGSTASAALLPVVNPSFEETGRTLAVGEQSNGMGGSGVLLGTRFPFVQGGATVFWEDPVEVAGWRTQVLPFGSPQVNRRGVLNPPLVGGAPFIIGQDGQNVAAAQLGFFQQTVNHQLRPNTRYRLDFLAGIGRLDSDYFAGVALLASPDLETLAFLGTPGVTELVRTSGAQLPSQTAGTLLPFSLEYTTPPVLPAELGGQYLAISCFGSDGFPRVVYDHFRLDATEVPEASSGVLMVLTMIAARMRRGVSTSHRADRFRESLIEAEPSASSTSC